MTNDQCTKLLNRMTPSLPQGQLGWHLNCLQQKTEREEDTYYMIQSVYKGQD